MCKIESPLYAGFFAKIFGSNGTPLPEICSTKSELMILKAVLCVHLSANSALVKVRGISLSIFIHLTRCLSVACFPSLSKFPRSLFVIAEFLPPLELHSDHSFVPLSF